MVAKVIAKMPQDVAIAGHTDALKFASNNGYSNWELSTDRANAARRSLISQGISEQRIARIVGRAATEPIYPDDPAAPGNRRVTVLLLRGTGDLPPGGAINASTTEPAHDGIKEKAHNSFKTKANNDIYKAG
jgi:chemotaxis protein MotB